MAAVLATYFAIGLALTLGLGLTPETVIRSDAAYLAQAALGTGMLAYAVLAPGRTRRRGAATARRLPAATRPAAVFTLGVAVTALELPTALPYLGAVGMTRADLAVADDAAAGHLQPDPPCSPLLLAGHVVLGERAGAPLERLRDRLGGTAREALLWVLGLVGFFSCSPTPSAGSRSSAEHAAPALRVAPPWRRRRGRPTAARNSLAKWAWSK